MKTKVYKLAFALIIALGFLTYSCADLVVENLNEPDSSKALANPEDLASLAGGAFRTLHNAIQEYDGPALSMSTMADQGSCSWGNAAMRDMGNEPRKGWINSLTYAYFPVIRNLWEDSYGSISAVNDVLKAIEDQGIEIGVDGGDTEMVQAWCYFVSGVAHGYLGLTYAYFPVIRNLWEDSYGSISAVNDVLKAIEDQGVEIGVDGADTEMVQAWCYFVSGVAHGYLGLTYDQGNVIKWDTDLETLELSPYQTLLDASVELLDQAISIAGSNSFEIPAKWMGGEIYTNTELSQLASSYAARILAYGARNKATNEGADWSKVLSYANNGIEKDLAPELGDNYDFYDFYMVYQIYPGWGRIDHRIINLMDPDYPSRYAEDGENWTTPDGQHPGEAESDDARLLSDFEYVPGQAFRPDRGYYHFSNYRLKRYDDVIADVWYGDKIHASFYVWENEMLKAEAMVRTGNTGGAIAILNDPEGARKVRGQLPDVTASDDVLWTIFYERDIELVDTGMGIGYFDMRRRDQLQRGSILHYPVPMTELEIIQVPVYTIGGAPDGENVSEGSWTGLDGITSPLN